MLAKIASVLGNHGVSLASVIQKGHNIDRVPLIFITHRAKELSLKRAIDEISFIEEVISVANVIRVEK